MPSSACSGHPLDLHSFPTRRSSDLGMMLRQLFLFSAAAVVPMGAAAADPQVDVKTSMGSFRIELYPAKAPKSVENFLQYVKSGHYNRSEEHTSELQSLRHLVCRLLLALATPSIYTLSLHDALPISA